MTRIVVYTAITDSKDVLREDQVTEGAEFVAFLDPVAPSSVWQTRPACRLFTDPRRNARIHKILAHQYFPTADYSLWMDGPAALQVPVQTLIDEFLWDADICLFEHPERDCVYQEADVCGAWRLDDPGVLCVQAEHYQSQSYPAHGGLYETGLLLRRHTREVEAFNNAWWSELCRHSKRDQISFPYVLAKSGVRVATFPGTIKTKNGRPGNPYFDYAEHGRPG